ncbi:MAG: OmpA family protein [Gammaproteobacteria bacterium]|nr:OmpA family protein [Gammaproteobacteria bacterium]MBU1654256.1 OmpA family protein [Gammaproteobacteria bacterium]MBU1960404.1 OmpA family protein [Gammaproteobacteria bacterium]
MKIIVRLAPIALSALLMAGCSGMSNRKGGEGPAPVAGSADTSGVAGESRYGASRLGTPGDPLSQRVVFFEYDSNEVTHEGREILLAHARKLSSTRGSVTLEGHCDERGSREYNIALGERRASAARSILTSAGVSPSQILTISYGEERPAEMGVSDDVLAKNRRVEIVYR